MTTPSLLQRITSLVLMSQAGTSYVDDILSSLDLDPEHMPNRTEAVKALRKLEEEGKGVFKIGRRGGRSRFERTIASTPEVKTAPAFERDGAAWKPATPHSKGKVASSAAAPSAPAPAEPEPSEPTVSVPGVATVGALGFARTGSGYGEPPEFAPEVGYNKGPTSEPYYINWIPIRPGFNARVALPCDVSRAETMAVAKVIAFEGHGAYHRRGFLGDRRDEQPGSEILHIGYTDPALFPTVEPRETIAHPLPWGGSINLPADLTAAQLGLLVESLWSLLPDWPEVDGDTPVYRKQLKLRASTALEGKGKRTSKKGKGY